MDNKQITVTSPLLPNLDDFNEMLKQIWESKWITNNGSFHKQLEKELEVLNAEKAALEESLNSGMLKPDELVGKSQRLGEVIDLLDEKEMRWLELSELA